MRQKLINLLVLCNLLVAVTAEGTCLNKRSSKIILPKISNGFAIVTTCASDEGRRAIYIDVFVANVKRASGTALYENRTSFLSIDSSIDFDGVQGLGVSTGDGRDGNGMHYWTISKDGRSLQDLGDAPRLINDKFLKGYFSALVSSTGEYQSFRDFYAVRDGRLILEKAIGFGSIDSAIVVATYMSLDRDQIFSIERRAGLSSEIARKCQSGETNCW